MAIAAAADTPGAPLEGPESVHGRWMQVASTLLFIGVWRPLSGRWRRRRVLQLTEDCSACPDK